MKKQLIHEGWQMCCLEDQEWMSASVPGDVYSDLLANGKMEDPFFKDNEYQAKALMEKEYEYRTEFDFSEKEYEKARKIFLHFDGIDTLADIYLNGTHLGETISMHRIWEFPVEKVLKDGKNELRVVLHSPLKFMA